MRREAQQHQPTQASSISARGVRYRADGNRFCTGQGVRRECLACGGGFARHGCLPRLQGAAGAQLMEWEQTGRSTGSQGATGWTGSNWAGGWRPTRSRQVPTVTGNTAPWGLPRVVVNKRRGWDSGFLQRNDDEEEWSSCGMAADPDGINRGGTCADGTERDQQSRRGAVIPRVRGILSGTTAGQERITNALAQVTGATAGQLGRATRRTDT